MLRESSFRRWTMDESRFSLFQLNVQGVFIDLTDAFPRFEDHVQIAGVLSLSPNTSHGHEIAARVLLQGVRSEQQRFDSIRACRGGGELRSAGRDEGSSASKLFGGGRTLNRRQSGRRLPSASDRRVTVNVFPSFFQSLRGVFLLFVFFFFFSGC